MCPCFEGKNTIQNQTFPQISFISQQINTSNRKLFFEPNKIDKESNFSSFPVMAYKASQKYWEQLYRIEPGPNT